MSVIKDYLFGLMTILEFLFKLNWLIYSTFIFVRLTLTLLEIFRKKYVYIA